MKRLASAFERRDKRGIFIEVAKGRLWKAVNFWTLKKGSSRGGHYHKKTLELFFAIEGSCRVEILNIKTRKRTDFIALEGGIFLVEPYELHRISGIRNSKFLTLLSMPYDRRRPDIYEYRERK